MHASPYLINNHSDHKQQVNSQCPEQKHLGAGELPSRAVMVIFGGNQLVRLQRSHHRHKFFAVNLGIQFGMGPGV